MRKVVIVGGARTPFGSFGGALKSLGATQLGSIVIREALRRASIPDELVDECIMGMVLPCGYGQNPAKQAVLQAGLGPQVAGMTINKVCGSALKAVMLGAQAIRCGDSDIVVAGGMESMSNAPYFQRDMRWGARSGHKQVEDHMIHDGLWDIVNDMHMGMSNEYVCKKWQVSREEQDKYAEVSYNRALKGQKAGFFQEEIVPVPVPEKGGNISYFEHDECIRETDLSYLQSLWPVFKKGGCGTAGNSSAISDGAAAVVLMAEDAAKSLGCWILAEIGAQASGGIDLKYVLMAPLTAIPKVLDKGEVSLTDVDLIEVNEAFSGSSVAINKELQLDTEKVNVNGGCVAIGHPIGASGARLLITLVNELHRRDKELGLVSLCLGGGEAVAMLVHRR